MISLKIQILVDNPTSWIIPYATELVEKLKSLGYIANLIHKHREVTKGDILCLLSCEKIFKDLNLNKYNLVVHESDLPKGKGWSPVTWQVLEGKNKIPVTLFEAGESVDSGPIYLKKFILLDGTELLFDIKQKQGKVTQNLILNFIKSLPFVNGEKQIGEDTFYNRRSILDSELNVDKSIRDQFDLLRVCDNERYPAFFIIRNQKYTIKIFKENDK